jgi:hypothetical protein
LAHVATAATPLRQTTLMMIYLGLTLIATGIVALSLEGLETALVLFGIAGWLIRVA